MKKEGEAEEPHVAEDEEQIDWWSRYYETVRDKDRAKEEREAQIEKQKKLSEKKGKTTVHPEPEEEEEIEEEVHSKKKKKINPKITRLKVCGLSLFLQLVCSCSFLRVNLLEINISVYIFALNEHLDRFFFSDSFYSYLF